ncbi:hypothetical protein PRIPAC_88517, partial [Pristionchus pacificus]
VSSSGAMLCIGEGIPYDFRSLETILLDPRMSQQTDSSSGESSPEQQTAPPPPGFTTDTDDTSSLLDGPTHVPSLAMIPDEDALSFVPEMDFQISSIGGGCVYSDYYDRIREDAEWDEMGHMTYVPLYTHRTSHGSFSSDRLSSEGSVSPTLPSPIGDHLKAKRDSSSSIQFPIVPGAPQVFPDPFAERAREGYGNNNNNNNNRSGAKPYATIMEPKTDYGLTAGGEYGSSSQDSQTDVFGGSQESLNQGYGGYEFGSSEYGRGGYGRLQQQQQRLGHNGGRMATATTGSRRQHYSSVGSGYGSNGYNDYGTSYAYDQTSYDSWRGDAFESTNKYGGPINGGGGGGGGSSMSSYGQYGSSRPSSMAAPLAAAAAPQPPAGPLPTAFSRANINDEQKNNLMANLARLCNQRSY